MSIQQLQAEADAGYFKRLSQTSFGATEHTSGAWDPAVQHIAPALGLLTHLVELDRDERRRADLVIARLSFDILGTVPVDVVETTVGVVRSGRSVELVESRLRHQDRDVVRLRAWFLRSTDSAALHATALPRIPAPDQMPAWDPTTVWPGGFIASVDVRRHEVEPGRASFWVRTPVPLLKDEAVSSLARAAGLLDIANGMTVRVSPEEVFFPNVDLTAHLFRAPTGEWVGFDTTVSFGPGGLGVTSSVLCDVDGPVGTMAQSLTIRPTEQPPQRT